MKTMCSWCRREPYAPHLANCPALTGIKPHATYFYSPPGRPYLRRSIHTTSHYPHAMYLAEPHTEVGTPKYMYEHAQDEESIE